MFLNKKHSLFLNMQKENYFFPVSMFKVTEYTIKLVYEVSNLFVGQRSSSQVKKDQFFGYARDLLRLWRSRSSRLDVFCRKDVLKNFAGKHLC